jgi:hypothetical protein
MAKKPTEPSDPKSPRNIRSKQTPNAIDLHHVIALAPTERIAEAISTRFALDPVDFDSVRDTTIESLKAIVESMEPHLQGISLKVSLDRIVNAIVGAAFKAADFYSEKVLSAREITSKLANEHRDEDRDGVLGFDTQGERARIFAATSGLKAYALLASATGAVEAFHDLTGDKWKPYQKEQSKTRSVSRQSAAEELAAFGE